MLEKSEIRRALCKKRAEVSSGERNQHSQNVLENILSQEFFNPARQIALYYADDGEIDTTSFFAVFTQQEKQCYLPVIKEDKTMLFYSYSNSDSLINNRYGIPEPDTTTQQPIAIENIDIIFLPLVGFDIHGNRLGRGAGYYDRTLASIKNKKQGNRPLLAGLAFEFQKIPPFTANDWDVPLDTIITEQQIYWKAP